MKVTLSAVASDHVVGKCSQARLFMARAERLELKLKFNCRMKK